MAKANSVTGLELFPEPEQVEAPAGTRTRVTAVN
jgi:hypothetical protein